MAQLGARLNGIQKVTGSNPVSSTTQAPLNKFHGVCKVNGHKVNGERAAVRGFFMRCTVKWCFVIVSAFVMLRL